MIFRLFIKKKTNFFITRGYFRDLSHSFFVAYYFERFILLWKKLNLVEECLKNSKYLPFTITLLIFEDPNHQTGIILALDNHHNIITHDKK